MANLLSIREKAQACENLSLEFSSQILSVQSIKKLPDKYHNLKRKAKKRLSNDTQSRYKTGGGVYISQASNADERVAVLIGTSASDLNDFDGDASTIFYYDYLITFTFIDIFQNI